MYIFFIEVLSFGNCILDEPYSEHYYDTANSKMDKFFYVNECFIVPYLKYIILINIFSVKHNSTFLKFRKNKCRTYLKYEHFKKIVWKSLNIVNV